MEPDPGSIIDNFGGTTKVAKLLDAPISTVHSWRKNGIPPSRLAHLKLAAQVAAVAAANGNGEPLAKVG